MLDLLAGDQIERYLVNLNVAMKGRYIIISCCTLMIVPTKHHMHVKKYWTEVYIKDLPKMHGLISSRTRSVLLLLTNSWSIVSGTSRSTA